MSSAEEVKFNPVNGKVTAANDSQYTGELRLKQGSRPLVAEDVIPLHLLLFSCQPSSRVFRTRLALVLFALRHTSGTIRETVLLSLANSIGHFCF